jgi:hypothetical protein
MQYYKDKNLIYINGKAYKPNDLQDMINFYKTNYKPDIELPTQWNEDVSGQIFKNYPFYPSISKATFRPQLYYDQYCHLDITFREFIQYIDEEKPNHFSFLIINQWNNNIQTDIVNVNKNNDLYVLDSVHFNIEEGINVADQYTDTYDAIIKFIIDQFSDYQKIIYDVHTVGNIYERRVQCQQFNEFYRIQMISQHINYIKLNYPEIVNYNTLILYCSFYLFLLYNIANPDDKTKVYIQNKINSLINEFGEDVLENKDEFITTYNLYNIITYDDIEDNINFNI